MVEWLLCDCEDCSVVRDGEVGLYCRQTAKCGLHIVRWTQLTTSLLNTIVQNLLGNIPPLSLNIKTAGPLLRLLLAQRDLEEPDFDPQSALEVFKVFCSLPTSVEADLASFQATWTPEDAEEMPDPPMFYCTLARQLTETDEFGSTIRAVQIQWSIDPQTPDLEDLEVWSDEFPNLDDFFRHIEASAQFKALAANATIAELYAVELDG